VQLCSTGGTVRPTHSGRDDAARVVSLSCRPRSRRPTNGRRPSCLSAARLIKSRLQCVRYCHVIARFTTAADCTPAAETAAAKIGAAFHLEWKQTHSIQNDVDGTQKPRYHHNFFYRGKTPGGSKNYKNTTEIVWPCTRYSVWPIVTDKTIMQQKRITSLHHNGNLLEQKNEDIVRMEYDITIAAKCSMA